MLVHAVKQRPFSVIVTVELPSSPAEVLIVKYFERFCHYGMKQLEVPF
jgi:hypothetical protein